ncbi:MAG: hypothetical protein M5U28_05605 [Sandaracinaceae bacterium]|nr:hypothetical protein [Sandaracinaceae bacterium]
MNAPIITQTMPSPPRPAPTSLPDEAPAAPITAAPPIAMYMQQNEPMAITIIGSDHKSRAKKPLNPTFRSLLR